MDCALDRDTLDSLLDGELDPARKAEVEAHLATCEACRARARAETLVRERIAALAAAEKAPAELRERVTAAVLASAGVASAATPLPSRIADSGPRRTALLPAGASSRRIGGWRGVLVLAACVAAILLVWMLTPRGGVQPAMAAGLVADHREHHGESGREALHRETDPAELARWLEARIGRPLRLPRPPPFARLVGGQICVVEGRRVAHAVYDMNGETVSYFLAPEGGAAPSPSRGSVEGVNYVARETRSQRLVVVGSVSEEELARLADS